MKNSFRLGREPDVRREHGTKNVNTVLFKQPWVRMVQQKECNFGVKICKKVNTRVSVRSGKADEGEDWDEGEGEERGGGLQRHFSTEIDTEAGGDGRGCKPKAE